MNDGRPPIPPVRRELILYATPSGLLADQCEQYFRAVSAVNAVNAGLGETTAQTYPPHCTLTGFFRRTDRGTDRAIAEMLPVINAAGSVPDHAVKVLRLLVNERWVGLELQSPWLKELAASVAGAHTLEPGDDALRPKDWLHLSLAYGTSTTRTSTTGRSAANPLDLAPYGVLAKQLVDTRAAVSWEVGLWERSADQRWIRH